MSGHSKWSTIKHKKGRADAKRGKLFTKVILADTFSGWASAGFDMAESLSMAEAWATSLSYTFRAVSAEGLELDY